MSIKLNRIPSFEEAINEALNEAKKAKEADYAKYWEDLYPGEKADVLSILYDKDYKPLTKEWSELSKETRDKIIADDFFNLNESKMMYKRKYTERHPQLTANENAKLRNDVCGHIYMNGSADINQLKESIGRTPSNQWFKDYGHYFETVIKEGSELVEYKLSKVGKKMFESYLKRRGEMYEKKFSTDARGDMAKKGWAMPDGSFPIETVEDAKYSMLLIDKHSDPNAVRKHIMNRLITLGREDMIPKNWNQATGAKK